MIPKNVGVLGFDGVNAFDVSGPLEAFATARRTAEQNAGASQYNLMVIALEGKTFTSQSGVVTQAQKTIETAPPLDTVVVPGGAGFRDPARLQNAAKWITDRTESVRRIVCVSEGIYPVAIAGLLDNRYVTTHWRIAQDVAQRFPALRLNYAASFLKDGPFYTCGGGSAAVEMTLALIQEDYGTQFALSVARELVVELRPPGEDDAFPNPSDYQSGPMERLAELPAWIAGHLREKLSRQVLAERAGLCERHFARLFKRIFHQTPADFVEHVRLSEARRRLLLPRNSIDSVAASVGFTSAASFRRAFERRFGVTPRAFRARFEFGVQDVDHEPGNTQTVVTSYKRVRLR
jgi:transcriptional regulator GlxA family with amidase domain